MEKQQLRRRMQERLSALDEEALRVRSECAAQHLTAFREAGTLLCYAALPREADPAWLVAHAQAEGKRVAFPRCLPGGELEALVPRDEGAWVQNRYGIWEPDPDQADAIAPEALDLIFVPGLAFNRAGGRLGRGAGYYDRYLPKSSAIRIGFCLSLQLVETLPLAAHDVRMDWIATEEGCIRIGDICA